MIRVALAVGFVGAMTVGTPAPVTAQYYKSPPVYVPVVPLFNWTGFYIGGHVGYGWASKDWRDSFGLFDVSTNLNGFLGGGQVGFNYQVQQFVFGVEGDFSWTGIKGGSTQNAVIAAPAGSTFNTDVNWTSTLTGRLGLAFDREG